jgi:uncharacterized protein (DUF1778 family)
MAQAQKADPGAPRRNRRAKTRGKTTSNVINLRADDATRSLIDRAASALGQNRTEFMLMSARVYAQEVLLKQVYFELGDADWKALNEALESPPPPNAALKRLMSRTPSWEK